MSNVSEALFQILKAKLDSLQGTKGQSVCAQGLYLFISSNYINQLITNLNVLMNLSRLRCILPMLSICNFIRYELCVNIPFVTITFVRVHVLIADYICNPESQK